MRQLKVDDLWLQEVDARRLLPLQKIGGKIIPADLMTKIVFWCEIADHLAIMGLRFEQGRAYAAGHLH